MRVELDGRLDAPLREAVVRDLSAGLPRMVVCTVAPSAELAPASTVVLTRREHGATIEVHDAVTDKRVSRDVDLSGIPEDGHALALAVASDELLRASWSELALRRRAQGSAPAPPEVNAAVQDVLVPGTSDAGGNHELAARAAFERYGGGQVLLGGEIVYGLPVGEALVIEAWIGLRRGLSVEAPHGTVDVDAWVSGLGVRYLLGGGGPFQWGPVVGFQGGQAEFRGSPSDTSTRATPLRGPLATVRGGAAGALRLGPFVTGLAGGAGVPLARLEAMDGGIFVSGISGPEAWLQASAGAAF